MAPADTTTTYRIDLHLTLNVGSLDDAGFALSQLIELAETRGFKFELGSTTSVPPVDD